MTDFATLVAIVFGRAAMPGQGKPYTHVNPGTVLPRAPRRRFKGPRPKLTRSLMRQAWRGLARLDAQGRRAALNTKREQRLARKDRAQAGQRPSCWTTCFDEITVNGQTIPGVHRVEIW